VKVPEVGIEPTRGYPHGILSIAGETSAEFLVCLNYLNFKLMLLIIGCRYF